MFDNTLLDALICNTKYVIMYYIFSEIMVTKIFAEFLL